MPNEIIAISLSFVELKTLTDNGTLTKEYPDGTVAILELDEDCYTFDDSDGNAKLRPL